MKATMHRGADTFEVRCDLVDVTSNNRPDVGRVVTDINGHAHPWCGQDGKPATSYSPSVRYTIPSIKWVKEGVEYDDGEEYDVGHYECLACGATVVHPMTADSTMQHIAGLKHCYINGAEVTHEEFERRFEEAKKSARAKIRTMAFADYLASVGLLPTKLRDGKLGVVISWDEAENLARIQVPGEDDARMISGDRLTDSGNGALREID